jgi:hypothetical protein
MERRAWILSLQKMRRIGQLSFVHWLQAVWLAIVAAQLVQLYYLRKQRKRLAAMVRTFERLNATLDSAHSEDKLI